MSSSKYLPPLTPAERGAAAAADGTLQTGLLGTTGDEPDGTADEVRYADFLVDEDDEDDEDDDPAVDRIG
ncbi:MULTISPECIES: hypothetical protein [Curtobacterium]|uniref:hypothetical protein n=1 Tax=Curtobacterium TaxID=2034 RepID=UPI0018E4FD67|nr:MULTISPECIES: hypothetical protein [Curtobacterium]MCA5923236.1 hypothetical protein [Curtobacterium oceanosedimentum]QQD76494.1 hypothetical protein I8920_01585 [Curtobacterium sp. YC1]